ncbi:Stk1 family PASTA domain-containing Ser/Thr kinase [Frigoribacterium sp. ACAM 257]|uniref:Stk1 family PASTA domain-containing Ser/Thr kinase n=1 Tax=Frigoribacterium sp. ACAM 257 TaxID=2508998 RepID=UPI0011B956B3|nr:Stk1 family PASTA domain-containing Ser/Thr kinase [Frigoribacterium sp. ACAM 257]TWX40867.1 Stk1 family PASTA domain-containing Ser/Thr kinase [Frigoribacterium sp. ACAM 257]
MSANQTDPMIGRLIDDRYQVRSRIARGGMATVYLATDLRLERRVAIKIMHGHLADDASFKERFIQEARSAARLAHPNVVNVFDQGQDDDSAYLVMEYLPGITLRELLQDHKVLTSEQAMDILEAVLAGLAAAHRAGIVHRDLKPENVLLADDGRIKIGDFGLARAATANTATGAALLGTIAYLSPELVTRGVADTRSDIYALGIMLYEMLTGEQPYKGEQPMQIAYQHANDTVPSPSSADPSVPAELDELVLWATARDPEQRPRDARAMLDQLIDVQRVLADPTGAPLGRTMVLPPASATMVLPRGATGETQALPKARHRTGPVGPAAVDTAAELGHAARRRRRRGFVWIVVVLLLAVAGGGAGWWFGAGPGSQVAVPDVTGQDPAAAASVLEAAEFVVAPDNAADFSVEVPTGQVIGTDPGSSSRLQKGSTVTLVVSQGPQPLDLPTVVGQTEDAARASLSSFAVQDSTTQFDAADPGTVLAVSGVDATGAAVDLADTAQYGEQQPVTLTVSLGPVPDVVGQTVEEAQAALQAVELTGVEAGTEFSSDVDEGSVIRADPQQDGPVRPGASLDLVVSKGPPPVTVPDVTGKTIDEATAQLQALGLRVSYDRCTAFTCAFYDWEARLPVLATDPPAQSTAARGSTVRLSYRVE